MKLNKYAFILSGIITMFPIFFNNYWELIDKFKNKFENTENKCKLTSFLSSNGDFNTNDTTFSNKVYQYISECNISHKDIVFAQAKIESGHFNSNIFKVTNNMFGMKRVYQRPTTQIGSYNNYGIYRNWQESIIDYALWQSWCAKKYTEEDYLELLSSTYAEDKDYITLINQIRNDGRITKYL